MATEIRFALRRLLRAPAFTLVAVTTLALGLGANTAIFSVVEAVLLRPLPYPEPDRLVLVWQDYSRRGGPQDEWFSPANFFDWRDSQTRLAGMGAFSGWQPTVTGDGNAERLAGGAVTHGFFEVLGLDPVLGRAFAAEEDLPGAPPVILVSHGLWQRRLGGRSDVVGSTLVLDGEPQTVVGVLPEGFVFPLLPDAEVFRPFRMDPAQVPRGAVFLRVVARLAPGVSEAEARQDLEAVARRLEEAYPDHNTGVGAHLTGLREQLVGPFRAALLALLGAVGLVLLIACVNLASLLLVRAQARSRERSVRRALGAGRARQAADVVLESLLITTAGSAVGLGVAVWLVEAFRRFAPIPLPPGFEPTLNPRVVAFSLALAVMTGVLSGLAPAISGGARNLARALREGSAGSGEGRRSRRTRAALVVGQVALAFTLLLGAGLLLRSFTELRQVDPGFDPGGVLAFGLSLPSSAYAEDPQVAQFYAHLLERVEGLPGVESVGMVSALPMSGSDTDLSFVLEGEPAPEPGKEKVIWFRQASPDYFQTLRIGVLAGRTFAASDGPSAPPVVVLGEAAAKRFFPDGGAVGQRLKPGSDPDSEDPWWTVVGVVENVRHAGLAADPKLEMYLPHAQAPRRSMTLAVRTAAAPEPLVAEVRAVLQQLDPSLALTDAAPAQDLVARSLAVPQLLSLCTVAFALVALLLAVVGLYGVVAQSVGRRTRELGLRMALGADRGAMLRLVMVRGMGLVLAGLAVGLLGALWAGRLVGSLLFGVTPADAVGWISTTALLLAAAALATWLPARRATRLDPLAALREE